MSDSLRELREQTPVRGDNENITMMDAPATPDEPGQPSQTTSMRSLMSTTTPNASKGTSQKAVSAKDEFGLPGSAWTNKKAKEEYDMAAAKLAHPQWNMTKYGDPLLRTNITR